MKLEKVISGGQTGVDQAALQAAIDSGINHGGWCPPGRVCENWKIPDQFNLVETPEERSPDAPHIPRSLRTEWNIRDADASLVIIPEVLDGADPGTSWAMSVARKLHKPMLIIDPKSTDSKTVRRWILENKIKVLGVGGPSEMTAPGIYDLTYGFMKEVLLVK